VRKTNTSRSLGALAFLGIAISARAADRPPLPGSSIEETRNVQKSAMHAWERSLIPFAASQALDGASSYGLRETNPLLAGPNAPLERRPWPLKWES
jgi:hypothetical protein